PHRWRGDAVSDATLGAELRPRHFRWRVDGRVGVITLDRPERKHALTFEPYRELIDTFVALSEVPNARAVRAVVLAGAAEDFCTGGDVQQLIGRLVPLTLA